MIEVIKLSQDLLKKTEHLMEELPFSSSAGKHWHKLFEPHGNAPSDPYGYALLDGDEVVGLLGTIFSERLINQRKLKVCNITSWIVKKKYRSKSLALLYPILKLENCLITNLTPSESVYKILQGFGFQQLDTHRFLLLPIFNPKIFFSWANPSCLTHRKSLKKHLNKDDLKFFLDHSKYSCRHVLFHKQASYCYIILTKTLIRKIPFCAIQYCSNITFFLEHISYIKFKIIALEHTPFIIVDPRIIGGHRPLAGLSLRRKHPTAFKAAEGILPLNDNLYTELILLNL